MAGRYYSDANWDGAATLVQGAGPKYIKRIFVDNENAAARFLQVFNAAAVADVTLGTTEPDINCRIPATDNRGIDVEAWFDAGVVIAVTDSTRGATTSGTNNIFIGIG